MVLSPLFAANCRYLVIATFPVDPPVLATLVPAGTELDFFESATCITLTASLLLDARVMAVPLPLREFEEVSLRFYVRRRMAHGWQRGAVVLKRIVPPRAISLVAPVFHREPHLAMPIKHDILDRDGTVQIRYQWRRGKKWDSLAVEATGQARNTVAGSYEEFLIERSWVFPLSQSDAQEYRIEHPRWRIWRARSCEMQADFGPLCGDTFTPYLRYPQAAFIVEGSYLQIFRNANDPALIALKNAK